LVLKHKKFFFKLIYLLYLIEPSGMEHANFWHDKLTIFSHLCGMIWIFERCETAYTGSLVNE